MSDPLGKSDRGYGTDHNLVNDFANDMFAKLRINKHKAHWSTVTNKWLFDRLIEEAEELRAAMVEGKSPEDIIAEAADVANFAAMIADNLRN